MINTTGVNTNGINNLVFNIHGKPNTTGSFIENKEGTVAILANVLYLLLFANRIIHIINPIVAPAPPGDETVFIHE